MFIRLAPDTSGDLYVAALDGDLNDARPLLATAAYERGGKVSPDGRWLAYASNDSGQMEVYLGTFPEIDRRWQVSTQGGTQPRWNPDGREIVYRNADRMMAVRISTGTVPTLSKPTLLFEQPYAFGSGQTIPNYDISADGQRFVMVKEESNARQLNLVFNWFEEPRQRVPTP